jgi:hypothetical protein
MEGFLGLIEGAAAFGAVQIGKNDCDIATFALKVTRVTE